MKNGQKTCSQSFYVISVQFILSVPFSEPIHPWLLSAWVLVPCILPFRFWCCYVSFFSVFALFSHMYIHIYPFVLIWNFIAYTSYKRKDFCPRSFGWVTSCLWCWTDLGASLVMADLFYFNVNIFFREPDFAQFCNRIS